MATPKNMKIGDASKIDYLHNVSPVKTSKSNYKYFNAVIQTADDCEDIVSFKAEAHKTFVDMSEAR